MKVNGVVILTTSFIILSTVALVGLYIVADRKIQQEYKLISTQYDSCFENRAYIEGLIKNSKDEKSLPSKISKYYIECINKVRIGE